jgi:transcriptional regulator with XRE-family HTH domain
MKERIKLIRIEAQMTQEQFAQRLGLSRNFMWMIESGDRTPGDRTIRDICREFGINESWLRFGLGDMHQTKSREQELGELIRRRLVNRSDSFQAALVTTLLRFDPDGPQMQALEQILQNLIDETKKDPEP